MADHTELHDGFRVVYWRGYSAATRENADRAEVEVFWSTVGYTNVATVHLVEPGRDSHLYELERLMRGIARVYEHGKRARSREIHNLISGFIP